MTLFLEVVVQATFVSFPLQLRGNGPTYFMCQIHTESLTGFYVIVSVSDVQTVADSMFYALQSNDITHFEL